MPERDQIYYWKCDRAAAFHGIAAQRDCAALQPGLLNELQRAFPGQSLALMPGRGQGNHLTWSGQLGGRDIFVRVEDGPEQDDYIEVESYVMGLVGQQGVPTPEVLGCDATRKRVPFAWQVLERIPFPDLNEHDKKGDLNLDAIAFEIGKAMGQWQGIRPEGFGPFHLAHLRAQRELRGLHRTYSDYFQLRLEAHLTFLTERGLLTKAQEEEITGVIREHASLLDLQQGCLVHKDLALWNMLGSRDRVVAFIDWDDCISGDAMDDLSLLGCFHSGEVIQKTLEGYAQVRALPQEYRRRFWLHLLRNMIVKAVIRTGAGYFERNDSFFLIGSGNTGASLKDFTRERLRLAVAGLKNDLEIASLPS